MDGDTAWLCVPTALAGLLDELRASGPGTIARTCRPVRRVRAMAGLAGFAARPVHVHGLGGETPRPAGLACAYRERTPRVATAVLI